MQRNNPLWLMSLRLPPLDAETAILGTAPPNPAAATRWSNRGR